jgi:hypothetical protein
MALCIGVRRGRPTALPGHDCIYYAIVQKQYGGGVSGATMLSHFEKEPGLRLFSRAGGSEQSRGDHA